MKGILVIPSAWKRAGGPKIGDADLPFATPLDRADELLPDLIRSFRAVRSKDVPLIVFGRAAAQDLEADAARTLQRLLYTADPSGGVKLFSHAQLRRLIGLLEQAGRPQAKTLLTFRTTAGCANTALALGQILGVHAVLIYGPRLRGPADAAEAERTIGWLGAMQDDRRCLAISSPRVPPPAGTDIHLKPPFHPGGALAVHRDLLVRLPFDPASEQRPEEDYVLNAATFGYDVLSAAGLSGGELEPLPEPATAETLEARYRHFARMRNKIRFQKDLVGMRKVQMDDLRPYPAEFLGDDLEEKFAREAEALSQRLRATPRSTVGASERLSVGASAEAGKCEALAAKLKAPPVPASVPVSVPGPAEAGASTSTSTSTSPSTTPAGEEDAFDAYLKVQRQWVELQEAGAGMKVSPEDLFA